ncbi:MAG: hypothetical protein WB526_13100 [Candidatus Cybelea sp.]
MLFLREVTAAVIAVSLAACGGTQVLNGTNVSNFAAPGRAQIPSCKGQKNTKQYGSIGAKPLSSKGGTLCVPSFGGWGGTMDYPGPTSSHSSMGLISSTTAYNPGAFPPQGSVDPIFYIQFKLNTYGVIFGAKLPATGGLSSKSLTVGKSYTAQGASDVGSLWDALGECSTTAFSTKYGATIRGIGFVLENVHMGEASSGVISILPGKLATKKC